MGVDAPGIYGKLPAYSDFVSQELSAEVTHFWHEWMRSSVYHSRNSMEESKWLSLYLISPPWRFLITDRLIEGNPMMGVMIPSVDRVGRYFPFIMATGIENHDMEYDWVFNNGSALLDIFEKAGIKALQERWTLEDIGSWLNVHDITKDGITEAKLPSPSPHYEFDLLNNLKSGLRDLDVGSVWWTSYRTESLCTLTGMPSPEVYAYMLGGMHDNDDD